jgi:hypothetical protein
MKKNILKTNRRGKKETLETLIKLHNEYNYYLRNVFSPVWGLNDGVISDFYNKYEDERRTMIDRDHPFFG